MVTTDVRTRVVGASEESERVVVLSGTEELGSTVVVEDGERMDEDTADEMEESKDDVSIDDVDEVTGVDVLETEDEESVVLLGIEEVDMVVEVGAVVDEASDEDRAFLRAH